MKEKHEAFSREYIIDSNGAAAAIRAGYSESRAKVTASELLNREDVKSRIAELRQEVVERNKITIDEVVQGLANIFRADVSDFVEAGPFGLTLREVSEMEPEQRAAIKKLSFKKGSGIEFELLDKLSAAEKLMKHLGGYEKDNSQKKPPDQISVNFETKGNPKEV